MSASRSFERAAGFYDQTRQLPEAVEQHGLPAILEWAGPGGRVLEVGCGTGRVGVPLLQRGADWVGCDLAPAMMQRLREKAPAARLARADAVALPFAGRHFDLVLTAHVMHLVAGWTEALREFRRVLRPGGVYLNALDWRPDDSVHSQLRACWRSRVEAHGGSWRRPGAEEHQLEAELRAMGARLEETEVVRFQGRVVPQEVIADMAARSWSDSWDVPEPVFQAAMDELQAWARETLGDLTSARVEPRGFRLLAARFPG